MTAEQAIDRIESLIHCFAFKQTVSVEDSISEMLDIIKSSNEIISYYRNHEES